MMLRIHPTEEMYQAPINGVHVPTRIWKGTAHAEPYDGGEPFVEVEVYVLATVPVSSADTPRFKEMLPPYMGPARNVMTINVGDEKP